MREAKDLIGPEGLAPSLLSQVSGLIPALLESIPLDGLGPIRAV